MTHVATHCGGVGEPENSPTEPPEITITIHNHTMLNYAVAMKRWPDETDGHWEKRKAKLDKLRIKVYELASIDKGCPWYEHEPSYVHPEP